MSKQILPSGEEINLTPLEILNYLNPDGVRQMMRQERLRWNLKPNTDVDFYDNQYLYKYTGALHNNAIYQKMEIRTFPDNGAYPGYAGVYVDSGLFGFAHNLEKWDKAVSDQSRNAIVNRVMMTAMANIPQLHGYGLGPDDQPTTDTQNRMAAIVLDPYDGRGYIMSNDDPHYVNNETRSVDERIPDRAIARMADIPTRITQLKNDLDFIADPDYRHTDNNFTDSNRFVLDNMDDRTFLYPEIAKDTSGNYIDNYRVGLSGDPSYGESDGSEVSNTQPDLGSNPDLGDNGDRFRDAFNSYNKNKQYSGVLHRDGYLPGIFRSLEELERVDLIDQMMAPLTHADQPGSRRPVNYYNFDGIWGPTWFDRYQYKDSYLAQSLNPNNMEIAVDMEPTPIGRLNQTNDVKVDRTQLHQWRYNRVDFTYRSSDIVISIVEQGQQYKVGDILRWTFGDDVFLFEVETVGPNGQLQKGSYRSERDRVFEQDPSTHGVGLPFSNMSGVGHGAKLAVYCKVTIKVHATQIKNNLYAYVDVTPSVRSDNTTPWSDNKVADGQDGRLTLRSTAPGPGYTGINSGRGGPSPNENTSNTTFYEHGGNATAGVHVHLFRYVINTQNPSWVIRDGIQVFTGRWVDQGPMGVERPCDIKALYLSNFDTNNFNNYYKFMLDIILDNMNRNPDGVITNNANALSPAYLHSDQCDPKSDQKFYIDTIDPETSEIKKIDVTDRVIYTNAATGMMFMYNSGYKNDPKFGYGLRSPGWYPIAGATIQ